MQEEKSFEYIILGGNFAAVSTFEQLTKSKGVENVHLVSPKRMLPNDVSSSCTVFSRLKNAVDVEKKQIACVIDEEQHILFTATKALILSYDFDLVQEHVDRPQTNRVGSLNHITDLTDKKVVIVSGGTAALRAAADAIFRGAKSVKLLNPAGKTLGITFGKDDKAKECDEWLQSKLEHVSKFKIEIFHDSKFLRYVQEEGTTMITGVEADVIWGKNRKTVTFPCDVVVDASSGEESVVLSHTVNENLEVAPNVYSIGEYTTNQSFCSTGLYSFQAAASSFVVERLVNGAGAPFDFAKLKVEKRDMYFDQSPQPIEWRLFGDPEDAGAEGVVSILHLGELNNGGWDTLNSTGTLEVVGWYAMWSRKVDDDIYTAVAVAGFHFCANLEGKPVIPDPMFWEKVEGKLGKKLSNKSQWGNEVCERKWTDKTYFEAKIDKKV